jgi:hypothetical protein
VLSLVVKAIVFSGLYLTFAPLARAVKKSDLAVLGMTLSELRFIGRFVAPILCYEGLVLSLAEKNRRVD